MNAAFWLVHPELIVARLRGMVRSRLNSRLPWLSPGTLKFLEGYLDKQMIALEFGSGRSTSWMADRVGELTSVEYDAGWAEKVAKEIEETGLTNVKLLHVSLDHSLETPEADTYDELPKYVAVASQFDDESLDFCLVDGHYRTRCIEQVASKIRAGGVILVDDAQRWHGHSGPFQFLADWRVVDDSTDGIKRAVAWQKPAHGGETPCG